MDQQNVFYTFDEDGLEKKTKDLDYIPVQSKYRKVTEGLNQVYKEIMEELDKGGVK